MTQPISTTPVSTTPSCWESFTNTISTGMTKVAEGVVRLWNWVKGGIQSMCAAIRPQFAKLVSWFQTNPREGTMVGVGAAVAAAIGAYFICGCGKDKTVVAPAATTPAASGAPAATAKTATA